MIRLLEQCEAFLSYLALERQASGHTLKSYRRDIQALISRIRPRPFESLQAQDIRRLIAEMHASGLQPRSLARRLSVWRRFYHYLQQRYNGLLNPCQGIRPPRAAQRLPAMLSQQQTHHLLSTKPSSQTERIQYRDQAIKELLYSSGLRVSELTQLEIYDLNFAEGEVIVRHGKGKKARIVPLGKPAIEAAQRWLSVRGNATDIQALFLNRHGERLSVRTVQKNLRKHGIHTGIQQPVYPHLLRHACASHLLQESGDLRGVQELLGHASISTTQRYTYLDFKHLARAYDEAHPRARRDAVRRKEKQNTNEKEDTIF